MCKIQHQEKVKYRTVGVTLLGFSFSMAQNDSLQSASTKEREIYSIKVPKENYSVF